MALWINKIDLGPTGITINAGTEDRVRLKMGARPENPDCPDTSNIDREQIGKTIPPSKEGHPDGWYKDEPDGVCYPITDSIINYMDGKIVVFTAAGYTKYIACSDVDTATIVNLAVSRGDAIVRTIDLKNHAKGNLGKVRVKTKLDGTQYYDFAYNLKIDLPEGQDTRHIEVLSYMEVDFDKIESEKSFQSNSYARTQLTNMMGLEPNLEKVKTNGVIYDETNQFFIKGTDQAWTGPVHFHPSKGYMGGARHTAEAHPLLELRAAPNLKVVNNNGVKDELLSIDIAGLMTANQYDSIDRLNSTSTSRDVLSTAIAEPYISRNAAGESNFLFDVNVETVVRANSAFPGLKVSNIYRRVPIEAIRVFRQRANPRSGLTALGVDKVGDASRDNQSVERQLISAAADKKVYGESPYKQDKSLRDVASAGLKSISYSIDKDFDGVEETVVGQISEVHMSQTAVSGDRTFVVSDFELASQTKGKFRYMVEMQFKDPTILYLNRKLANICMLRDKLQDLHSHIDTIRAYDDDNGRYKNNYMVSGRDRHMRVAQEVATEMTKFLTAVTGQTKKSITNYMLSNLSIQTGSPMGIGNILEIINDVEAKLIRALGGNLHASINDNASIENGSKINNSTNANFGLITVEKQFNEIIDKDNASVLKCNYFNTEGTGFPVLTKDQYAELIRTEKEKYPDADTGLGSRKNKTINLSDSQLRAYNKRKSDFQYLTPNILTCGTGQNATVVRLNGENSKKDNREAVDKILLRAAQGNKAGEDNFANGPDGEKHASDEIIADQSVFISSVEQATNRKGKKNFTVDAKDKFGERNNQFTRTDDVNLQERDLDSDFITKVKKQVALKISQEEVRRKNKFGDVGGPNDGGASDGGKGGNKSFGPLKEKDKQEPVLESENKNFILSEVATRRTSGILNISDVPPSVRDVINKVVETSEDLQSTLVRSELTRQVKNKKNANLEKVPVIVQEVVINRPLESNIIGSGNVTYKTVTENRVMNLNSEDNMLVKINDLDMNQFGIKEGNKLNVDVLSEYAIVTGGNIQKQTLNNINRAISEEDNKINNVSALIQAAMAGIPKEFSGKTIICPKKTKTKLLAGQTGVGYGSDGELVQNTAGSGQVLQQAGSGQVLQQARGTTRLSTGGNGGSGGMGGSGGGGGGY